MRRDPYPHPASSAAPPYPGAGWHRASALLWMQNQVCHIRPGTATRSDGLSEHHAVPIRGRNGHLSPTPRLVLGAMEDDRVLRSKLRVQDIHVVHGKIGE